MIRSTTIRTLSFTPIVLALAAATPADTFVTNGDKMDGVYVRESNSGYFVSDPVDGSVQYFSKSSDATFSVEISSKQERSELSARWRQAHQARLPEKQEVGIQIDPERLAELYREPDKKIPSDFTEAGTPILSAKGTAKSNPATRARIQANLARMRGNGVREEFRFAPQQVITGGGGQGGGGQGGGGQGGGGQGGGGQGGGGQGGGGQGGGGQGGGFTNISDLFFTINDLQVGETPNLISGFGGQGGQAGGGQGGGGQAGGFN